MVPQALACELSVVERFPGSLSGREPPDPIPNSEVKTPSADDSVRSPHVKVGHCQDLNLKTLIGFSS